MVRVLDVLFRSVKKKFNKKKVYIVEGDFKVFIKLVKDFFIEFVENVVFVLVNFLFDSDIVVEVLVEDVVLVFIRIFVDGFLEGKRNVFWVFY